MGILKRFNLRAIKACIVIVVILLLGCKKTAEVSPTETFTKFQPPAWQVDESGKYPYSMTAVVALPTNLSKQISEGDQLGAFVNNECRGKGEAVKVGSDKVFFVLIRGLADEQSSITFKYYSATTSYMYASQPSLTFLVDDVYGTASHPKVLELTQLK